MPNDIELPDYHEPPEPKDAQTANSMLWTKVNYMQREIKQLQEHDSRCDERHSHWDARDEQHQEEAAQTREAIKQNAEAMIGLSHTLTNVNDTILTRVLPVIERMTKEYTVRDWIRKEGIPYAALILGTFLTLKHLFGG